MYVLREEKADYVSLVSASGCYIGGPIYVNPGILALVYGMTLRSFKCHNHNLGHDVSNVNVQLIQIILPSTNQQTWWSPWLPITRQQPQIMWLDKRKQKKTLRWWPHLPNMLRKSLPGVNRKRSPMVKNPT